MGQNKLYPVFLRLNRFTILIVGGGKVGMEKLHFILKSSPDAHIRLVAIEISDEIRALAVQFPQVQLMEKAFDSSDIQDVRLVIAATSDREVNQAVYQLAREKGILVNVADTPELCDFYLGSIVTKGDLKIGISTNGQSPTFAKRFREMLEDALPDSIGGILEKLSEIRAQLAGDFREKIEKLDEITEVLRGDKQQRPDT